MSVDIELSEEPVRHYVGVRRRVKRDAIAPACAEVLPRVYGWLASKGVTPAGPPMVVYHAHLPEEGVFDLQPGFFVAEPLQGQDDIALGVAPAAQAATTVHRGPYDGLPAAWQAVHDWVAAQDRTISQASFELYLNDPGELPPEEWLTRIVVPLDPA